MLEMISVGTMPDRHASKVRPARIRIAHTGHDAEFSTSLLRFLQLTSEGHNNDWQNYLRNQPGNPTIVNLVICVVDFLLRLQESIMDFYWYYSRKELIDPAGQANFFTAIGVASQVFNTITEVIQVGKCTNCLHLYLNCRFPGPLRGQPTGLGHVSSLGCCRRFPFPLCTSSREALQECLPGMTCPYRYHKSEPF